MGGPGILFSANFDGRFDAKSNRGLGYRIGLGFAPYTQDGYYDGGYYYDDDRVRTYATIPLGLNYLLGREGSSHFFEVGAGATILTRKVSVYNWDNDYGPEGNVIGHVSFMYRRQPADGGFMWKIGFMTMIGTSGDIVPSAGVGFGYAF